MKSQAAGLLSVVREKMRSASVGAIIVPSSDAHNSEYVGEVFQRRGFLTNFRGSAGTAVITLEKAFLWTDGRYWLEAGETLYPEFQLMKQGQLGVPSVEEWLVDEVGSAAAVGLDPFLFTIVEWERMERKLQLKPMDDVVGPLMPPGNSAARKIFVRPAEFCGATCDEKVRLILNELDVQHCDFTILSALDEVAWLTNLRGSDVLYNPVFYSYAIVHKDAPHVRLFVDEDKLTDEVRQACGEVVSFHPYETLISHLHTLQPGQRVLVDELQTSHAVHVVLQEQGMQFKRVACGPAQKLKAVKNPRELQGFRECHVRDGLAVTRYLAWLHDQIAVVGNTNLSEYASAKELERLRAEGDHYVQLSFSTISSTGANAAIAHYMPPETGSAMIAKDQLYLVDSGAQYLDGTTDVTRTVCFTTPTEEEREAYTLVLKGNIALNRAIFPRGTAGHQLDSLARTALWRQGLNYAHGTGHGVGSFLNVHEGPHGVGTRSRPTDASMDLHTITSNEPGYYKDGHFGIRIENLEEVVEVSTKHSCDGFLGFSTLTMVPLCRELIDLSLLSGEEKKWVNHYSARVREVLLPLLAKQGDEKAVQYLQHHTQQL